MITQKDLNLLSSVFTTKDDLNDLRSEFTDFKSLILSAVDGIAKKLDSYHQEVVVLNHRVTKVEKKIGMR